MIRIFTDTSANLPLSVIERYKLTVLPFTYIIDNEVYAETADFDGKKFYGAMAAGTKVQTSMVNAFVFYEAFEQALKADHDVLYIGMSGGISGTFKEAQIAVNDLGEKYPQRRLCAFNTLTASMGEGLQVMYAADLVAKGLPFDEIVAKLEKNRDGMCSYFTVDDLGYLLNTGRISRFSAKMGTVLQIKPILTNNEEGQIILHHKVRTRKKSLQALVNHYDELITDRSAVCSLAHADSPEDAAFVEAKMREKGFRGEMITVMYEPVTGSHVGPGAVALFFHSGKKAAEKNKI